MDGYLVAVGKEFATTTAKWKGIVEGGFVLGGYAGSAWLWWTGAATWQTVTVGALTTVVLVLMVYSAGRSAWISEHRERVTAHGLWRQIIESHANNVEWDKAISIFRGLLPEQIEATYTERSDGTTEWNLWGASANAQLRACDTACRIAAHALGLSKTGANLPKEITNESDGLAKWLHYVASEDGWTGMTGEGVDNTQSPPLTTKSKGIKDVPLASKRLCEYCRDRETYL